MQGPVVLAPGKPPTHMTMPTLSNLSSLTQLTELALSDVHNRLSLPGLQHLPCLSNLRSAFLETCSAINMYWRLLHSMLTCEYKHGWLRLLHSIEVSISVQDGCLRLLQSIEVSVSV